MTTLTYITAARELDHRSADGIDVSLLWHPTGDFLSVVVSDTKLGRAFELVLDEDDDAMDVFTHPYAYAAHRGLEFDVPTREEELVTV